jgi:subtilisin family serine protease
MAVRDFVNTQPGANVYQEDNHGTLVWSVMAGVLPGQYRGAAPDARYALVRTENAASETLDEELTWAAGAEWAATNGIRLINSSLGYSTFDNPADNHDYQDLDGNTTPIAQAARIAVSKGLLVVNSAGNEGQGLWERILTPCDVDGLLCVGGTFSDSLPVPFSSKGPTGDGRIKPDVVAWASNVPLLNPQGFPQKASGTSFSTPLVAGLAACLWSAKPEASAQDVFRAIRKTAWLPACALPNNTLGWGIPNGPRALAELRNPTDRPGQTSLTGFRAWFTTGHIHLDWPDGPDVFAVDVLNLTGQQVGHYQGLQPGRRYRLALPDEWPAGVYILRLSTTSGVGYTRKLIYAAD